MSTPKNAPEQAREIKPSFLESAGGITVEAEVFGSNYPVVTWINGDPSKKQLGGIAYGGGWFIDIDQGVEIPGFSKHTLMTKNGTEVEGFASDVLEGEVIEERRCWEVAAEDDDDNSAFKVRLGYDQYDIASAQGKARQVVHVLFVPKGLDFPVILVGRGYVAGALVGKGKDPGAIPTFGQRIINAANRLAAAKGKPNTRYPLCAFSLKLGAPKDASGAPIFTEVGSKAKSKVTLPVLLDTPKGMITEAQINALFVGPQRFMNHQVVKKEEGVSWKAEWNSEVFAARNAKRSGQAAPAATTESADVRVNGQGVAPTGAEMPM